MNIIIAAGGAFHAHRLASQMQRKKALVRLFTFDAACRNSSLHLDHSNITLIQSCSFIDRVFNKLRLGKWFNKAYYNLVKDVLFDFFVQKSIKKIKHKPDLFVGWSHYVTKSLRSARLLGAKIIIESGSSHILMQQKILLDEYAYWGVSCKPIHQKTIKRILDEYEQADYIMTLSLFARNTFLAQGIDEKKVLMSPCGADIEFFLTSNTKIKNKKFTIIFVGLVSIRKGVSRLIAAWKLANLPFDDVELLIVGQMQKDFSSIVKIDELPKNIYFIGPVNRLQLKVLYQKSSLSVVSSVEEGFGMVILESMASGVPVICTTHSAGPEIITHGVDGFLYDPYDIQILAEYLTWCYEHKEIVLQMGECAKKNVAHYSWNNYGERVYDMYRTIINM